MKSTYYLRLSGGVTIPNAAVRDMQRALSELQLSGEHLHAALIHETGCSLAISARGQLLWCGVTEDERWHIKNVPTDRVLLYWIALSWGHVEQLQDEMCRLSARELTVGACVSERG